MMPPHSQDSSSSKSCNCSFKNVSCDNDSYHTHQTEVTNAKPERDKQHREYCDLNSQQEVSLLCVSTHNRISGENIDRNQRQKDRKNGPAWKIGFSEKDSDEL